MVEWFFSSTKRVFGFSVIAICGLMLFLLAILTSKWPQIVVAAVLAPGAIWGILLGFAQTESWKHGAYRAAQAVCEFGFIAFVLWAGGFWKPFGF
jgi:hypothetical protein